MTDIPHIGQPVYYIPSGHPNDRYAAIVARVNKDDGTVNLSWLSSGGYWLAAQNVPFVGFGTAPQGAYAIVRPVYSGEPAPQQPVRDAMPADHA